MRTHRDSASLTATHRPPCTAFKSDPSFRRGTRVACRAAETRSIRAALPQSSSATSSSIPIPSLPPSLQDELASARRTWLRRCLDSPLVDSATNSRVHIYGTTHFAPHGGAEGLDDLRRLIDRIQPTLLAIEQPFDLAARAGLPYPELISHLAALLPMPAAAFLAGPPYPPHITASSSTPAAPTPTHPAGHPGPGVEGSEEVAARLRVLLPGLAQPARVGRDLLDPFEVLGFYGGCDYATQPGQLMAALELFGHLPGLEYAAAAAAAQEAGVQVYSVDAPLRLQETWVAQLVAGFSLRETDLARRLQQELDRAQALLPPEYQRWDAQVAEAVRRMEVARLAAQEAAAPRGGTRGAVAGPSEAAVVAFKVARAVAAAAVPYERCHDAVSRQGRLQPLKFGLFARRARHLLLQVRDLCQRMTVQQVRMDASALRQAAPQPPPQSPPPGAAGAAGRTAGQQLQLPHQHQTAAAYFEVSSEQQQAPQVVLLVAGRQYVPYIEEMWLDERSVLWHGDVPRTFAASRIPHSEPPGGAASHGGAPPGGAASHREAPPGGPARVS